MNTFADELDTLVQKYLDQGNNSIEEIISDMQLKVMELEEQEED